MSDETIVGTVRELQDFMSDCVEGRRRAAEKRAEHEARKRGSFDDTDGYLSSPAPKSTAEVMCIYDRVLSDAEIAAVSRGEHDPMRNEKRGIRYSASESAVAALTHERIAPPHACEGCGYVLLRSERWKCGACGHVHGTTRTR